MNDLTRYLNRLFFARLALLLFGIVSVVLSFDLLERSDNVLAITGGGPLDLLQYAMLRAPDVASQLLPIAALLAAVLSFGELSRHRELDAMWASGVSPFKMIRALVPAAAVLISLQFSIDNWGVPESSATLRALGVGQFEDVRPEEEKHGVWLRSGKDILRLCCRQRQAQDVLAAAQHRPAGWRS